MSKIYFKTALSFCLIFVFIFSSTLSVYGAEATSTSYSVTNSSFGSGNQMDSTNFSVTGSLSQSENVSYSTASLPLVPGNITSCGKIITSGTYTLTSDLSNITTSCFSVLANDVIILGAGHTITGTLGNASYAVVATSSATNGGFSFSNLNIQDITFNNFAGGVNANGNDGTASGGNGGSVVIASSTIGSITANGGTASSGVGGNGGTISITGTDIHLAGRTLSAGRGTGLVNGSAGTINVSGSILVASGEVWTADDTLWQGLRTYKFTETGYSSGVITGTTTLMSYTASSTVVTVDGNTNFHGTGKVNGIILDSLGEYILTWDLINGSILTGSISGDIIFNDTSKNSGVIFDNATFNDYSYNSGTVNNAIFTAQFFNSVAGIPNGDPTGISNSHSITGSIIFSATASPVVFSVGVGSVWNADTSSWVFVTSGQNWIFSFGNNTGHIIGDVTFNSSQNNGQVDGISVFNTNSYNAGATTNASFYGSSYNIGTVLTANFYDSSTNSHSPSSGTVSVRCDFFNSSLPGSGSCPLNATFYHIPYYFNGDVSTHWGDVGNWWFDASSTEPTLSLPQNGDIVVIGASMTSGPSSSMSFGSIIVASSTTGGGSFSVDFTNASGPAYFYSSSTNSGEVDGVFHIFGNRSFSQVNTAGTYTGAVAFHNNSWNDQTVSGDAIFYDTSYNSSGGRVEGNAEFIGTNINNGIVVGVATIYSGATLSGSGTVQNNTINSGDINSGIFNGIVTSIAGSVTGSITNLVKMIFGGGSYVSGGGRLSGDAEFNATSSNRGVVSGDSVFNNSSYNVGSTSNATFIGDLSENVYNSVTGIVSGIKTRLYTALAPQINLFRNFADSAWTIVADNTVVKLLFGNLINTSGQNVTTLVERNGGVILRPLTPGIITSCGVLDTENGTYTLGSNISNYSFDTCFIIRANGVTLDGNGHGVSAQSSGTSLYAIISTTTMSVDATSSAFTNLSIKNIEFSNFAKGLLGRGTDVPFGVGGNGTSVIIDHTTIGDIDVSGGDPTERGGDGGDVTLETSTTNIIISNGGNSTACGVAGNGGNITITTDSIYATSTNEGGVVSGCPEDVVPVHGAQGRVRTDAISAATIIAQTALQKPVSVPSGSKVKNWDFTKIKNFLLPVLNILPINLKPVPTFGNDTKGSFSFLSPIQNFIFALLPKNIDEQTSKILVSLGVKYQKDLIKLQNTPLVIKDTKNIPGLFAVNISGLPTRKIDGSFDFNSSTPVTSYITYNLKTNLTQQVKVSPREKVNISVEGNPQATFNGKKITFANGKATITVPIKPGKYNLISPDSKVHLVIEVVGTDSVKTPVVNTSNTNVFKKLVNWFINILGW
jgi:hypothetical protein